MKYEPLPPALAQVAAESFAQGHPEALLLAYSPSAAQLFRWTGGAWADVHGGAPNWDDVFSLRVFDRDAELRWTHDNNGLGQPVQVTAGAVERLYHRRLWGASDPVAAGAGNAGDDGQWALLREARIGVLAVPNPGPRPAQATHIRLVAAESLDCDDHGNWSVIDERLLGLEWV